MKTVIKTELQNKTGVECYSGEIFVSINNDVILQYFEET
ncbi:unnamed protein product, partial [Urochloa humidicola]